MTVNNGYDAASMLTDEERAESAAVAERVIAHLRGIRETPTAAELRRALHEQVQVEAEAFIHAMTDGAS